MEQLRESKFYNSYPNCRIREYLQNKSIKASQFAKTLNDSDPDAKPITAEAVRQWVEGYSRPDHAKIPLIAKLMGCTCDYLYGVDTLPTKEEQEIFLMFDLSDKAVRRFTEYRRDANFGEDLKKGYKAQLIINLISDLLESGEDELTDIACLSDQWKDGAIKAAYSRHCSEGPYVDKSEGALEIQDYYTDSRKLMLISAIDRLLISKKKNIELQAALKEKLSQRSSKHEEEKPDGRH